MKRFGWLAVAVLIVAIAAVPAQAAQADYKFKIFGGLAYVTPMADSEIDDVKFETDNALGYEFGAEWKPLNRLGFELALVDVSNDVEADGTKVGDIGMQPVFITANFHIINSDRFAWYAGPTVAFISWDDFESDFGGSTAIEDETTFGVSTGIDLGLGEHLAIIGGLRWIDSGAEDSDTGETVDVNPLFARVALAWRF
jgi:outer membrane protein W